MSEIHVNAPRVVEAIRMVRHQIACDADVALGLMSERAKFDQTTLETVAAMVLDGRVSWAD